MNDYTFEEIEDHTPPQEVEEEATDFVNLLKTLSHKKTQKTQAPLEDGCKFD